MLSKHLADRYVRRSVDRCYLGDILKDIEYFEWITDKENAQELHPIKLSLPYIVVLSQDCDLLQDFDSHSKIKEQRIDEDKFLTSILVCPAYTDELFRSGEHLLKFGIRRRSLSKKEMEKVKKNEVFSRYHYLISDIDKQIPNLVLDFKSYYTLPRDRLYEMYSGHYLATINNILREQLSQRFSFHLSRIGIPTIKKKV